MATGDSSPSHFELPKKMVEFLSEKWEITSFHPPQVESLPIVLSGKNLLLAAPTASGKTLVAQLAIIKKLIETEPGSRAVYIVPLKALASEKVSEMEELAEPFGLKVGIGIGDRNNENSGLDDSDIVVCTSEKFDSLLRNRPKFLERVSIVIADEVHLVNDASRGPTLEVNLARIMLEIPHAQIVALSATVGNAQVVADWLQAELVVSEWRPVPLRYATLADLQVEVRKEISGDDEMPLPPPKSLDGPKSNQVWATLSDTIAEGGQLLCFVGTRKSAQSVARELANRMKKKAEKEKDEKNLKAWKKLSEKVAGGSESSQTGDMLAESLDGGVAFHHAGLTSRQRKMIEEAFKRGDLVCISATPTLAAGVNLPARRVLIRDLRRWDGEGSNLLSTMEVQQMMGRAGRPKYDNYGEAWIRCKSQLDAEQMSYRYFESEPEDIISKLHIESPMRMHVLAAIATGGQTNRWSLGKLFSHTFLAMDVPREPMADKIDGIVDWLCDHGMVERRGVDETLAADIDESLRKEITETKDESIDSENWDDNLPPWAIAASSTTGVRLSENTPKQVKPKRKGPAIIGFQSAGDIYRESRLEPNQPEQDAMTYQATPFGERISRLYLDPLSGHILQAGLRKATEIIAGLDDENTLSPYSLLHLIATVPDFMVLWPKKSDEQLLIAKRLANESHELVTRDLLMASNLDLDPLVHTKSAITMEDWIEELSHRGIEQKLGVAPGDLRIRIDLADWLIYACKEISRYDKGDDALLQQPRKQLIELLDELRLRIINGCKPDLLELVSIRGVGRVRARHMAKYGVRTVDDVLELTEKDQKRLAEEWGWSRQLVDGIMEKAGKVRRTRRRS
ncbi:MAG TPA: DEAD/DEAH box helicase [Candidatus Thalassarchaeaceae archaeon]|nr:DEAD/DEAH box helicase [Candidatus Thalassarchaeaceae archaeon]